MLTVLMGRARTGKSDTVLRRIAEAGRTGRQILLVPEHASHQAEVDLCRACGDAAALHAEVLSFRRLGDRVAALCGGADDVTLDGGGKLLTLQRALLETAPLLTVYRRPSGKTALLEQMLALFDELRAYEVPPELLAQKAQEIEGATHEKLSDLSLLYAAYEARLHRPGLDARDRMTKLCDRLEESGYVAGKDIFIDGFTYFTAQERRVLSAFLRQARSVTVTLLGEPDSRDELFEASVKTLGALRRLAEREGAAVQLEVLRRQDPSALGHLERCFFGAALPYEEPCAAIRLRQAESVFAEVEETAADIRRLVAAGRCRYRDVTVAARNMDDYESVIETVFERYEIPAYLSRRSDILEKPVLSLLTGVLSAVAGGYEYDEMFRWLKTGLAGLTPEECDLLENYVLKWEIHGGMWLRETDWTENPDGYGVELDAPRQARLDEINALRARVRAPLARLAEGLKGVRAGEKIEALYSFMEELAVQDALHARMEAQAAAGRLQEAEETAQLWEILCGVMDQFMELLGDEQMDLDTFIRLFCKVLTQYSVGTIPASLDQVSVSEITRNDRHTGKYFFLLGANDHVLPATGESGGVLNEDDREELALRGVELAPGGMERMGIELQNLYAALVQPTEGLTVSYPVSDVSGAELRPAFVVERLRTLFPALETERADGRHSCRLSAPLPALETAGQRRGGALWRFFEARPENAGRLAAMERAAKLRRGALSPDAVEALYGRRISMTASRLERLRSCHFAYFMEYGLRAKPRTAAAFDAPQIGTFLHFLLERVTRSVRAQGGFGAVDDEALREMTERYIQEYTERELPNLEQRGARFRYLYERLHDTAVSVVLQAAEELRHSDFVPLAFELSFGGENGLPAVTVSEPDGEMRVRGKVDRVDGWVKDGRLYLRVVDYKSGKKAFDLANVRMGLDLQMLLYLFALEREGGAWLKREIEFDQGVEPAGVLYLPARDDILTQERNVPPEKLQREREKALRRSGLLLAQPEVLCAMEHEALTEPHYLPVRVNRNGDLSGSIASAAQLGSLGRYVESLLGEIAAEVRQGNIDADPCCHGEEDSRCRWCDWASACHFKDGREGDRLRYILPVKPEEFWNELAKRGEDT